MKSLYGFILCLLIAFVAGNLYLRLSSENSEQLKVVATSTSEQVSYSSSDQLKDYSKAIKSIELANEPLVGSLQLASEFQHTKNLYAFVQKAKTRMSEGGAFYARHAVSECSAGLPLKTDPAALVSHSYTETHRTAFTREKALEILRNRCSGFNGVNLNDEIKNLLNNTNVTQDPLYTLNKVILAQKNQQTTPEQQSKLITEIFKLKNPDILASWSGGNFTIPKALIDADTTVSTQQAAYSYAWRLVSCDFGSDCGVNDLEVINSCYQFSICVSDRETLIAEIASSDKQSNVQFEQILKLKQKIVEAIKQNQIQIFIREG